MNFVRSNSRSLKYQRFTSSSCEDIGVRKFKFVARTQSHFLFDSCRINNFCDLFFCLVKHENTKSSFHYI